MCLFVSIGYRLHRHLKSSFRKNHNRYSPIEAWFVIALVVWAHKELEEPKAWSHGPLLMYDSSMISLLMSMRSRKFLPLPSDAWKVIFHRLMMLLLSDFLQKSQDILLENDGSRLNDFDSLLTNLWSLRLRRLGYFQNSMEFPWPAEKNCQSS